MDFLKPEAQAHDSSLPELFGMEAVYFELTGRVPPQLPDGVTKDELTDIIIEVGIDFNRKVESGDLAEEEIIETCDEIDYLTEKLRQL